jgi:hypothetical protein
MVINRRRVNFCDTAYVLTPLRGTLATGEVSVKSPVLQWNRRFPSATRGTSRNRGSADDTAGARLRFRTPPAETDWLAFIFVTSTLEDAQGALVWPEICLPSSQTTIALSTSGKRSPTWRSRIALALVLNLLLRMDRRFAGRGVHQCLTDGATVGGAHHCRSSRTVKTQLRRYRVAQAV